MSKRRRAKSKTVAYVFPGQGNLKTGAGKAAYEYSSKARLVINMADKILGWPLSKLCFEGPEADLRKTTNAQLAAVVTALAELSVLCDLKKLDDGDLRFIIKDKRVAFLAGHSVGYYAALVAAGVLTLRQCLLILTVRAGAMSLACEINPGKMLALIDPDKEKINELNSVPDAWVANYNSDGQVVYGGRTKAMEEMEQFVRQNKIADKVLPLGTEGAFHTPLMEPAVPLLSAVIAQIEFGNPVVPIIANSNALPITTGQEAKEEAVKQICSVVHWVQSLEFFDAHGVKTTIEMGGEVLSRMFARGSKMATLKRFISMSASLVKQIAVREKKKLQKKLTKSKDSK